MLECEVKLALNTTINKVRGGDIIPAELFKILKDNAGKCCTQYVSKFVKLTVATRLEKVSFHFNPKEGQCQRMLKHSLCSGTIACISHVSKIMLKILQARLQ